MVGLSLAVKMAKYDLVGHHVLNFGFVRRSRRFAGKAIGFEGEAPDAKRQSDFESRCCSLACLRRRSPEPPKTTTRGRLNEQQRIDFLRKVMFRAPTGRQVKYMLKPMTGIYIWYCAPDGEYDEKAKIGSFAMRRERVARKWLWKHTRL